MMEWGVLYKDGSTLEQYDKDRNEHLFKEIKLDEVKLFIVSNGNLNYGVNLIEGIFGINGESISFKDMEGEKKLIYFRRVKKCLGSGADNISHFLGFQIKGTSKKVILEINKSGHSFEVQV
jgi:hypothetical protein